MNKKPCFGILDSVFPMADDALRHTPSDCFSCIDKTDCLKTAINSDKNNELKHEIVDRSYQSGMISFWQRWSQKKKLHNKKNIK